MRKVILFGLVMTLFAVPVMALDLLGGKKEKPAASGTLTPDQLKSKFDEVSKSYLAATKELMLGNAYAFTALGNKELSEKLQAEANQIESGTLTKDGINKNSATLTDASAKAKESFKTADLAGEEAQKWLIKSMERTGKGAGMEIAVLPVVKTLSQQAGDTVKAASFMDKGKVAPIADTLTLLATALAGDINTTKGTLGTYIDYAKTKGIEIPADATAAFK